MSREFINGSLGLVQRLLEIGVLDRLHFNKIDRLPEKFLELLNETEIVVRVLHRRHWLELNKKIQIPYIGKSQSTRCRTEGEEALHSEISAKSGYNILGFDDLSNHFRILLRKIGLLHRRVKAPGQTVTAVPSLRTEVSLAALEVPCRPR